MSRFLHLTQNLRIFIALILIIFTFCACFSKMDGVPCTNHSDCRSGESCEKGICAQHELSTDSSKSQSFTGVDILFVMDNSGSMEEEQAIFSSSIFTLLNSLFKKMQDISAGDKNLHSIRVATTNSDMGVSYNGIGFNGSFAIDPTCITSPFGNNGAMITEYNNVGQDFEMTIEVATGQISCIEGSVNCPPGWSCMFKDAQGAGTCAPEYQETMITCPPIEDYLENAMYLSFPIVDNMNPMYSMAASCLANVGIEGCNFEQQLSAIHAAMTKHGQKTFLRANALTLIIVVTDEDDCSIKDRQWHESTEFEEPSVNLICGHHTDLLHPVSELRKMILAAKTDATGVSNTDSILFAAITGVPLVPECQGKGNTIDGCMDVKLSAGGTMQNPAEITRPDSQHNMAQYYEYACTRENNKGDAVTKAYPATRLVQMAQSFDENGYVYSICNKNWTLAMSELADMIVERLASP